MNNYDFKPISARESEMNIFVRRIKGLKIFHIAKRTIISIWHSKMYILLRKFIETIFGQRKYLTYNSYEFLLMSGVDMIDGNDRFLGENDANLPIKTENALVPVTIKQIMPNNFIKDQSIIIDGVKRMIVSIVGIIRKKFEMNIYTFYEVDDGTGLIQVHDYSQINEINPHVELKENIYVYVCGKINVNANEESSQPYISAFLVKPVEDPNQIPFHFLQAIFIHKYILAGSLPNDSEFQKRDQININNSSRISHDNEDAKLNEEVSSKINNIKLTIITFLKNKNHIYGVHVDAIIKALSDQFSVQDINSALEDLEYNGEIYCGVEADHYIAC